ncbi:MAG: hypothetical protein JNK27_13985 [Chitinophagaceae bacterium]|nr:hypothetical protein [Chitinophagaceae bacterium]
MKKFFAIAFIAATMVACNNEGESKPAEDTTKPATVDTPAATVVDTAAKVAIDTAAKAVGDTLKK